VHGGDRLLVGIGLGVLLVGYAGWEWEGGFPFFGLALGLI
jgi:hypothetical protein